MDRVARGDFFRLTSRLVVIFALTAVVNSVEGVVQCPGGVCVLFNICSGNTNINSYSYTIYCPGKLVCCRDESTIIKQRSVSAKVVKLSRTCDGSCVLPSRCVESDDSGIGSGCPANQICCKRVRATCDGVCTPAEQCRYADVGMKTNVLGEVCPPQQICCKNSNPRQNQFCSGVCVDAENCTGNDQLIDLRLADGNCPANKICCNNTANSHADHTDIPEFQEELCDGECVPLQQCTGYKQDNGIDLRVQSNKCNRNHVCCQKSIINKTGSCDGTCTSQDQCNDIKTNSSNVDLRFNDEVCPGDNVCCKSPRLPKAVPKPVDNSCECVPTKQCLDMAHPDTVDLRISENSCPVGQLCCKNARKKPLCDFSCVPLGKCNDSALDVDLRFGEEGCPLNEICCKTPIATEMPLSKPQSPNNQSLLCKGTCVIERLCPGPSHGEDLCPTGQVCCEEAISSDSCDGKCVSSDECADNTQPEDGINLRTYANKCSNDFVCCKKLKSPVSTKELDAVCNGSCVPVTQCLDNEIDESAINLRRLPIGGCSANEVCCTRVVPSPRCVGICTEYDNCEDKILESQSINLRSSDEHCPSSQVCCKRLKVEKTKCGGKCVPHHQCWDYILEADILNLRSYNDGCPMDETCCKVVAGKCNGNCVPYEQCGDSIFGIIMRNMENPCPSNQVCCKAGKLAPAPCGGKCVPAYNCPRRLKGEGCPNSQVCCDVKVETLNINHLSISKPPNATMKDSDSKQSQCTFTKAPSMSSIRKSDVPWLATVWSHQTYLGMTRDQFECVGTFLTNDLVLTSADCITNLKQEQTYIRIGDFNLKPFNTLSKRRKYMVKRITVHPDYDSTSGYANIAVLKMSKNSTVNTEVCLAQQPKDYSKVECYVIGWNKHDMMNDSIANAIPNKQPIGLADDGKCKEGFICAVEPSLQDKCGDQQGSPLLCFTAGDRRWEQVGLVTKKCETKDSSLIAVDFFHMWIREQILPSFQQMPAVSQPSRVYLPAL